MGGGTGNQESKTVNYMATKEIITIKVTVSQPALDNSEGEVSQSMLVSFGQWFKGDASQPDWNDRNENSPGYIRNRPEFRGDGPVEVEEGEKTVTVSLSASLLEKIYAVTESFWLSPLSWGGQKAWKS